MSNRRCATSTGDSQHAKTAAYAQYPVGPAPASGTLYWINTIAGVKPGDALVINLYPPGESNLKEIVGVELGADALPFAYATLSTPCDSELVGEGQTGDGRLNFAGCTPLTSVVAATIDENDEIVQWGHVPTVISVEEQVRVFGLEINRLPVAKSFAFTNAESDVAVAQIHTNGRGAVVGRGSNAIATGGIANTSMLTTPLPDGGELVYVIAESSGGMGEATARWAGNVEKSPTFSASYSADLSTKLVKKKSGLSYDMATNSLRSEGGYDATRPGMSGPFMSFGVNFADMLPGASGVVAFDLAGTMTTAMPRVLAAPALSGLFPAPPAWLRPSRGAR